MSSIKIYLLPVLLLFFISNQLIAQNELNKEKNKTVKMEQKIIQIDVYNIEDYTTEKDYNQIHKISQQQKNNGYEFYNEEEIYSDNKIHKRKKNTLAGEIVADVIAEVLINTVFIIATYWH
jgi:hypothetical protein